MHVGVADCRIVLDNLAALQVRLTPEELSRIGALLPPGSASGDRYHAQAMKAIDR